jgi:hypothetical protein
MEGTLIVLLTISIFVIMFLGGKLMSHDLEKGQAELVKRQNQLQILGKVPDTKYPTLFEWVIGYEGVPLIVGSNTVYHYLTGHRCSTSKESQCCSLRAYADMQQAAGKEFRIYTWKELLGEQE